MWKRLQRIGDPAARDALVDHYMPLARHLARRYEQRGEPLEDLVQVACLGLVKAVGRFDPSRGLRFSSFAVPTILGELKRHFRDSGWAVHVTRGMQERVMELTQAIDFLSAETGRAPGVAELSAYLKLPVEDVIEALGAGAAHDTASLDAPASYEDGMPLTLGDCFGEIDRGYEVVEHTAALARALRAMPAREQSVLMLRFSADLTQREIADRLGISQMHVSRLVRRALDRLRVVCGAA
jgi:RNA polymerase sigma-B factor